MLYLIRKEKTISSISTFNMTTSQTRLQLCRRRTFSFSLFHPGVWSQNDDKRKRAWTQRRWIILFVFVLIVVFVHFFIITPSPDWLSSTRGPEGNVMRLNLVPISAIRWLCMTLVVKGHMCVRGAGLAQCLWELTAFKTWHDITSVQSVIREIQLDRKQV